MEQLRKREKEGEGFSLSKSWLRNVSQNTKNGKAITESIKKHLSLQCHRTLGFGFRRHALIFPQVSGKLTPGFLGFFFFLSGGAVALVVFAARLTLGQSVLQSQADVQTGSLLKRLRRGCFPRAVLDGV